MRAIDQFLDHCKGNQSEAARQLGKEQGHVWYWLRPGKDMPLDLVPKAAKLMGKKSSDLRPDVFGDSAA